jgi:hypothetical protein
LHNRPTAFVEHSLQRLANAEDVGTPNKISEGVYNISGYVTKLGNDTEMSSCDCIDWMSNHWPCKHMFKAITVCSWNALSALIRQSQYLTIDNYCVDKNSDDISESTLAVHCNEMKINETNITEEMTEVCDVASECRELLQEITTCTYSDLTVNCLQTLRESLSATLETLRAALPNEHGLAILPRKRKRKDKHIETKKRALHSEVNINDIAPQVEIHKLVYSCDLLTNDENDDVMDSSGVMEMTRIEENESDALHEGNVSKPECTDLKQAGDMCTDEFSAEDLIIAAREHESQFSKEQSSLFCDNENGDKRVTLIEIHDEDDDNCAQESVANKSVARVSTGIKHFCI